MIRKVVILLAAAAVLLVAAAYLALWLNEQSVRKDVATMSAGLKAHKTLREVLQTSQRWTVCHFRPAGDDLNKGGFSAFRATNGEFQIVGDVNEPLRQMPDFLDAVDGRLKRSGGSWTAMCQFNPRPQSHLRYEFAINEDGRTAERPQPIR